MHIETDLLDHRGQPLDRQECFPVTAFAGMTVPFLKNYLTPCIPLRTNGATAKAITEATIPIQNIIMNRSP